jgi:hypothetical protein
MTDDAVQHVRSGDGQVAYRVVGSGPSVAWVPGTLAGTPPRSRRFTCFRRVGRTRWSRFGRAGHRDPIDETPGRAAARRRMKRSPLASHALLNENQTATCSRSRAQPCLTSEGKPDARQHAIFGRGHHQTQQHVRPADHRRTEACDRGPGFTVFNVIDHSGVAGRAGVQMPGSKLVMFGKPAAGAAVMVAAPLAALDIPLKVLVWVSVSYNSPGFLAGRHHLGGALRAPFDAVESIVEALPGA